MTFFEFFINFSAWVLFYMGVVNLARDAYQNAYRQNGTSFKSDPMLFFRLPYGAVCFAGWQMLAF